MFPAPSPNSQALFAQLASGGATPSTLDFHRTAMSAAAKRDQNTSGTQQTQQTQQQQQPAVTSQPQALPNGTTAPKTEPKQASGPFDPHDNDAANGLFMLAQGAQTRNGTQGSNQYNTTSVPTHAHPAPASAQNTKTSPHMSSVNRGSRGVSEGTNGSDESEQTKPASKAKGKKGAVATNGRRKAEEPPAKAPPSKKAKSNSGMPSFSEEEDSDEDMKQDEHGNKTKMTDEEKRKNFLERNRYDLSKFEPHSRVGIFP